MADLKREEKRPDPVRAADTSIERPVFYDIITPHLAELREALGASPSPAANTDGMPPSPDLQWGQWANWASWNKIL